ncbi:DUF262 domain-containing protein [Candidatus Liberibacter brunswickensis]|uniref:DUF262 domain-containing protein n=1 Tax=Candidatus Liberibacter brunswickensis TaxID=1968796 RepID=UPI002FE0B1D6
MQSLKSEMRKMNLKRDEHALGLIEEQINSVRKTTNYRILEYPIETIVGKFTKSVDVIDKGACTEIYISNSHRNFIWDKTRQSKFIESLFMDLPIPYLFVVDVKNDGCLEILDGYQRIETLRRFVNNELKLQKLERLDKLNGWNFFDLTEPMKRIFNVHTLRVVRLTYKCDDTTRKDIFRRLNNKPVISGR